MGKMKGYSAEIINAAELVRRIAKAYAQTENAVMRDIDTCLCEDENYTREKYLGIYKTLGWPKAPRLTIPSGVTIVEAWHVYEDLYGELRYAPVQPDPKRQQKPIIVGS